MSSFFTLPASQRKRKRPEQEKSTSRKQRTTPSRPNPSARADRKVPPVPRDESISGSSEESEDEFPLDDGEAADYSSASSSDHEDETAAERRLRLAEKYLDSIKAEVADREVGFDAEDIDRDLIAERLREDVAEGKGKLHRMIANTLDISRAALLPFQKAGQSVTGVAVSLPYIYTTGKDIVLTKWEYKSESTSLDGEQTAEPPIGETDLSTATRSIASPEFRIVEVGRVKGDHRKASDHRNPHHSSPILCIAVSHSGTFLATGGSTDRKLILWNAESLRPLKSFTHHRDSILSLSFQRNTNILYSVSKDRTVKEWNADQLGYIVTLFGHQDEAVDVSCLSREKCVSVGARDRSARFWNVAEETHTLHLGGGKGAAGAKRSRAGQNDGESSEAPTHFTEGSIDRVVMIDEETWVTGSDNGSICLWNVARKKPVFTIPIAHGLDIHHVKEKGRKTVFDPESIAAPSLRSMLGEEAPPPPQPRWITALAAVPYSDLVISGSWDGCLRVWRVSEDKKSLEALGALAGRSVGADEARQRQARSQAKKREAFARGLPTPESQTSRSSFTSTTLDFSDPAKAKANGVAKAHVPASSDFNGFSDRSHQPLPSPLPITSPIPPPGVADVLPPISIPTAATVLDLQPESEFRIEGVINDLAIGELGQRAKDGFVIAAAVGREHRLGRWVRQKRGRNGLATVVLRPKGWGGP